MPYTKGSYPPRLGQHFDDHGADFGAATEAEYEAMADDFLGSPLQHGSEEDKDSEGNLIRYNRLNDYFGILAPDGYIRTFYKPKPGSKGHGHRTNYIYFKARCKK
ncbi:MAG: hypothetical protein HY231_05055 [Acidobacteria bacterium]|nr:hypothetical protein [Acidobacteriota bacterium]